MDLVKQDVQEALLDPYTRMEPTHLDRAAMKLSLAAERLKRVAKDRRDQEQYERDSERKAAAVEAAVAEAEAGSRS